MPRLQKERKKALIFAGLLIFQLALISLQVPLGEEPSYLEKAIFFVFSPVQKGVHAVFKTIGKAWNGYIYLRNVESQNQNMREELFRLRLENILLRNGLQQLQDKEAAARMVGKLHRSFLIAEVIGVDASNAYKSIVIDKGLWHGLKSNMVIVDRNGNLVGRITQPISPGEASVELLTDDDSSVGVYTEKNKVMGILAGNAKSGLCSLKYIQATNQSLSEGEELFTSGYDKIFPAGIKVGRILSIAVDNSLFKKISVRPYLDFSVLSYVAVLTANLEDSRAGQGK
jgi:rod shape-determining protein MreC